MAYPFPSFGDFLFLTEETPSWNNDTGWQPVSSVATTAVLGGTTASPIMLGVVFERSFEIILTPDRLRELQAMIGLRADFCDWDQPVPNARPAFLNDVAHQEEVLASKLRGDPLTRRRHRVRVELTGA